MSLNRLFKRNSLSELAEILQPTTINQKYLVLFIKNFYKKKIQPVVQSFMMTNFLTHTKLKDFFLFFSE